MNVDLLRNWLKLPPGNWPPDHYTLLGLTPGNGDADTIELRVLERMDLLRGFQLAQPDLVTEGMNRLAQAQICLTDATLRANYDQQVLGLAAPAPVAPPPPAPKPKKAPPRQPPPAIVPAPMPSPIGDNLPPGVEVVDYAQGIEPVAQPDEEPIILQIEDEREADSRPVYSIIVEESSSLPAIDYGPSTATLTALESTAYRRNIYQQIAGIRRILGIWERLHPYLADPTHPLNRRVDAITMVGLLNELRPLLPAMSEIIGADDRPGTLVATLSRQPLAVEMFRGFLPSQRQALAEDWQSGRAALVRARKRLRAEARRTIHKPWSVRVFGPIRHRVQQRPEYILLGMGTLALLIAMWRSVSVD